MTKIQYHTMRALLQAVMAGDVLSTESGLILYFDDAEGLVTSPRRNKMTPTALLSLKYTVQEAPDWVKAAKKYPLLCYVHHKEMDDGIEYGTAIITDYDITHNRPFIDTSGTYWYVAKPLTKNELECELNILKKSLANHTQIIKT